MAARLKASSEHGDIRLDHWKSWATVRKKGKEKKVKESGLYLYRGKRTVDLLRPLVEVIAPKTRKLS